MGGLSKAAESLPEGFGYVIFAYVGNEFVNMWMAINVGRARKQYEVEYPAMYHKEPGHVFNCIQRAHQNTLEGHPAFIVMLFLSGLQYPKVTAGIGAVHALAKIAYATGYYTGGAQALALQLNKSHHLVFYWTSERCPGVFTTSF